MMRVCPHDVRFAQQLVNKAARPAAIPKMSEREHVVGHDTACAFLPLSAASFDR
jgi:hypothetical protein